MEDNALIGREEALVLEALDSAGLSFVRLTHGHASTMELCGGIGAEYGASHCKNLFLSNRSGNFFCLLLMEADKPFVTKDVSKKLGLSRMSFGTPEQLFEILGARQGSVSIMSIVNEQAIRSYSSGRLMIAVDSDLLNRDRICVHPNTDTSSLVVEIKELLRFLEGRGVAVHSVDI